MNSQKINKVDIQATYPNGIPSVAPQPNLTYPNQPQQYVQPMPYVQPQQTFAPWTSANANPTEQEEVEKKPKMRTGRPRNVMIMIMSLIFIILTVLAYTLDVTKLPDWASSLPIFNGLSGWEWLISDFNNILSASEGIKGVMLSIVTLFPMFLFTLSCISFLLALFGFIFKKYNRVINLIIGILIGVIAVTMLFYPQIIAQLDLKVYFKSILSIEGVMCFVSAGLGIIYLLFTILFMKAMKIKDTEEEEA